MRISARTHYALRAAVALAAARQEPVTCAKLAAAQDIPRRFCENILQQLRRAGLVTGQRGPDGGYWLARPPEKITLADVVQVTEGGEPEIERFPGVAAPLADIWTEMREHRNALLSEVTLADVVTSAAGPPSV
ncbi:Rrf2 family transcriptional regulator [Spongiactinospora sp. TRM90649]|uniref:RrF2 family transcriptional regulator n=1 Tax=Spongiactinospora sp. TRM90649 TaxID=3031114 RepID=UPI0023F82636|nr:Rrf2 family transcriptional regulator [Spongiactinospora sp. TRM90649]MDF5754304.1 Rrf2 family transcriptional regulator [Spongiactinospora sp. TRM90649]